MSSETENPPIYTLWNVYAARTDRAALGATDVASLTEKIAELFTAGVTVRGLYDVSGMRAGADLMVWLHGSDPGVLQDGARSLRKSSALRELDGVWSAMGVHRDAEFNRSHVPAFMRGIEPARWITVYPFNRSYEWYLLPEEDRRQMLAEHGRAGAPYRSILTNTVSAFALGDYEWILPLEAPRLVELVDMMRTLRATRARMHVRDEIPFFTGKRIEPADIVDLVGA